MNQVLLTLVLALVWATITGTFSILNLLLGAGIGVIALFILRSSLAPPRSLRRMRRILALIGVFFYEMMMSAISVARVVLSPDIKGLRPAFVAVPLDVKSDAEITLLANLITLTPGTLSADLSADKSTLFIHVLDLESREALIADIKTGFEARVIEVFKP